MAFKTLPLKFLFLILAFLSPNLETNAAQPAPISLESDAIIRKRAEAKLQGKNDYLVREVKRIGNRTVTLEVFSSTTADWNALPEILSDFPSYPSWVFNGINNRPEGGTYMTLVKDLVYEGKEPGLLLAHLAFDLPIFKHELKRNFQLESDTKKEVFTLKAKILPLKDSVIPNAEGVFKAFPVGRNRVWIYTKAWIKLKPWLLYQALPERLLQSETGERLQIILDNYAKEESRRRKKNATKSAAK